jgi:hypothetical protein
MPLEEIVADGRFRVLAEMLENEKR